MDGKKEWHKRNSVNNLKLFLFIFLGISKVNHHFCFIGLFKLPVIQREPKLLQQIHTTVNGWK